ncbi:MAG: GYD domain protein [Euryarchaeota archaeon]|jgi:uncharacterized protein with GYD domain|nr:GYD domain protein [Euryarchaeota archaeon]|tara:strand:+ start:14755 stop:15078 length:324 start_codon:yes stop_codon:yes gene_type:complete
MPKFLYSGSYTAEGAAGVLKEGGTARRDEAQRIVESFGGTLEAYYWCYGQTDFFCIVDVPDKIKMTAFSLAVGASGVFNGKLTPLITVEEMDEIANTDLGDFRLPGQ